MRLTQGAPPLSLVIGVVDLLLAFSLRDSLVLFMEVVMCRHQITPLTFERAFAWCPSPLLFRINLVKETLPSLQCASITSVPGLLQLLYEL